MHMWLDGPVDLFRCRKLLQPEPLGNVCQQGWKIHVGYGTNAHLLDYNTTQAVGHEDDRPLSFLIVRYPSISL